MNRCSRRPLAASVCLFIFACTSLAQNGDDAPPPCDSQCQDACRAQACLDAEAARPDACDTDAMAAYDICNDHLAGVMGFVQTEYDGDCNVTTTGTTATRLCSPNLAVAALLSRLDIDGDGIADNAADTDGDGLPDNWETGGFESLTADGQRPDRIVFFPAPSAIVPGTPPTPIFTRLAVATDALDPDTDDDGISDFVEVFGLMFIDENRNGLLDRSEWQDHNSDGLPSPGEFPKDNSTRPDVLHDFDGFVFTDPTNRDTDGDGPLDGQDNDPLVNPRAFGNLGTIIVRFNALANDDIDKDGIGNGMDMGNDLVAEDGAGLDFQAIDNPENISELLELFRPDLQRDGRIPESQIEDLLGTDWDGNGLWRTTDMRTWALVIDDPVNVPGSTPPEDIFSLVPGDPNTHKFYAPQTFASVAGVYSDPDYDTYGGRGIGMAWQDLLIPSGRTAFIPDNRVWAILYSWRMPGFDIDGDGFIGPPNLPSTARTTRPVTGEEGSAEFWSVALEWMPDTDTYQLSTNTRATAAGEQEEDDDDTVRPFQDPIDVFGGRTEQNQPELDGIIEAPDGFPRLPCGNVGLIALLAMMGGLVAPKLLRRR